MRPKRDNTIELLRFLRVLHFSNFDKVDEAGKLFATYLISLKDFQILDAQPTSKDHVGSVIVDWVLQVGHNWETHVKPAVERIKKIPEAKTLSGFMELLKVYPLKQLIGFGKEATRNDLVHASRFLAERRIDSYEDFYNWTQDMRNRDDLITFKPHPQGAIFRVGNKTADYIRVILGHWDAVAVDSNIKFLLK